MKVIELKKTVTASNDRDAANLRGRMQAAGVLLINLMSSPGSGKTTLIGRIIQDIGDSQDASKGTNHSTGGRCRIAVVEADIDAQVDAERIEALGARSIQAHTDGMCHMDAGMMREALERMGWEDRDLIFLENVGNLICPAEYDTGASLNMMILSVPEGDDKPLKYPLMFQKSDILVITKTDACAYFTFDMEKCIERVKRLNPGIEIFPVSAKTGEGMQALEERLLQLVTNISRKSFVSVTSIT